MSRRFHVQHSLEPDGILLTDTALLSHPGSKSKTTAIFRLMFAGVFLVLLLACANVGNVLARALDQPPNLRIEPDLNVLAFSVLLSVITSVLFGLAPALHVTRVSVASAMKEQAFGSRLKLRSILLGVQVALSVVLLVAAGLMTRGVQQASRRNPGFSVDIVIAIAKRRFADSSARRAAGGPVPRFRRMPLWCEPGQTPAQLQACFAEGYCDATRAGNRWLRRALCESAWVASRRRIRTCQRNSSDWRVAGESSGPW